MSVNELTIINRGSLLRVWLLPWAAARLATPSLSRANLDVDGEGCTQHDTVMRATCLSSWRTL